MPTNADLRIGARPPAVSIELGGASGDSVAAALGISQQRVSHIESAALGAIARRFRSCRSEVRPDELADPRGAKDFVLALTHAMAEVNLAAKWGVTRAELKTILAAAGIDSGDPSTWNLPQPE